MVKSNLLKMLLLLIVISLSMNAGAQSYNRKSGNNTSGIGTVVEYIANGTVNGVKGLISKEKDKFDDKDKNDKKDKKKDKKNKNSKDLQSDNDLSKKGNQKNAIQASKDDIELTVTGEGKTREDAKLAALRNALEEAYGVFVSSNTQLLNDEIVKDEIISISTGIIKHYDILAGSANGEMYDVVVKAIVTPGKLVSYAKQKGAPTELAVDGATLGANIRLERMNRENAMKAMNSLRQMQISLLPYCFDYEISDMTDINPSTHASQEYDIRFTVLISLNENAQNLFKIQKQISDLMFVYAQNMKTMNHNFSNYDRLQEWPALNKVASAILKQFYIEDDFKAISFYVARNGEKDEYNIYPKGIWKSNGEDIRFVESNNSYDGYYISDSGHSYYFLGYAVEALRYYNHHSLYQYFEKGFSYQMSYDEWKQSKIDDASRRLFTLNGYFNKPSNGQLEKMIIMRIPVCFSYSLDQVEKLTGIKLVPIS